MNKPIALLVIGLAATLARAQSDTFILSELKGAEIIAQDDQRTFLGKVANPMERDSIFNASGPYGSSYDKDSVWNTMSPFGNAHGLFSAFDPHAAKPPQIVKDGRVIGYLTTNTMLPNAYAPNRLKDLKNRF